MKCFTVGNTVVEDVRLEVDLKPFPRVVLGEKVWIPLGNKDAPDLCDLSVTEPCPLRWAWLNEEKYEKFSPALDYCNCPECGTRVLNVVASKTAYSEYLKKDKVQWMHPDDGSISGRKSWTKEDVGVMRTNSGRFVLVSPRGESKRCLVHWKTTGKIDSDKNVVVVGESYNNILAILDPGQKLWAQCEKGRYAVLEWHEKQQLFIREVDDSFFKTP